MSFTLVLNSGNNFGSGNNTYKYDFLQGNFTIPEGAEAMVANVQLPYSFYNITSSYNNNKFNFHFPVLSSSYAVFTITIPDGFYTTTSLNYYLQQWMISNGFYLVNNSGQNVYYYTIQYNTYQYGNQLLAFTVPTSLPSGFSIPSGLGIKPSVVITGDGSGATAEAVISNGVVTSINVTNGGTTNSYTSAPTVSLSGNSAGSGFVGTAVLSATGGVKNCTNNGGGSGYRTAPTVSFTGGGGNGATATATVSPTVVSSITIISGGSGYSTAPTIAVNGGGGTGATATATVSGGVITSISVTNGGSGYTSVPTISITGGGGTGGSAFAALGGGIVTSVVVTIQGSGYTSAPTIVFTPTNGGSGANYTANIGRTVASITVDNGGSGYPATTTLFGGYGFPSVSRTPSLEVQANTNFGTFIGFPTGLYPPINQASNYSINSLITPVGSTVNSIIIRCSLVNNRVGNPMDILDSFTIGGSSFGSNINYAPSVNKWVRLSAGTFSNFLITFCDQNLNLIQALDNNILITILFKFPSVPLLKSE